MTSLLDSIDWYDFLGRTPLSAPTPQIISRLAEQPILITGAGGSIGSKLALRLAVAGAQLILLESAESSLYELHRSFSELQLLSNADFCLGNAADHTVLDEVFSLHRPRLVFHAAAYKHVPLLEDQPFAAIENNIFATETLVAVATANLARVILLSTDKAVAPAAIMGATKRVAEQIVLNSQLGSKLGSQGTVLRLGNVLGSRGSVSEVFARQLTLRRPLTVTNREARRYFLTVDEAVNLLISAAAEAQAPCLLAPDISGPHRIADLADFMKYKLAPDRETSIEFTQLRAGDKETEQLWSVDESPHPLNRGGLILIDSPSISNGQSKIALAALRDATKARDLGAALAALRIFVPDYAPSGTVLGSRSAVSLQVADE